LKKIKQNWLEKVNNYVATLCVPFNKKLQTE
jgi:hypothetical protein